MPTNGYFTERTVKQIAGTLQEKDLDLFVAEISLDGVGEFHNQFRGSPGAFEKAMQTYDALAQLQASDARLANTRHLDGNRREHGGDRAAHIVPV